MREDRSGLKLPPANIEILGSHSAVGGIPVLSSIDDLDPSVDIGTHAFEARNLCEDGPSVFDCQTLCLPCSKPDAVGRTAAGLNPDHVVSELLEFLFHLCRSRLAYSYHADKGGNAHNQTQHGKDCPDQVASQRFHRFAPDGMDVDQHPEIRSSFISQRLDRIQLRCSSGRVEAKKQCNCHRGKS